MPLGILIALVVGGIAGIALLTHVFGFSAARRFADADEARAAFLREYPETRVDRVTLSADGAAALLETGDGPALAWAMGADTSARLLSEVRVEETPRGLRFRLPDMTAPCIDIALAPEDRAAWHSASGGAR
ncbi:hypothetical protein [Roseivivax sp.]